MTEPQIQKVEKLPETTQDVQDVDDVSEEHLNRPDQPDFDPAEREPYTDPDPDVLPTSSEDVGTDSTT